VMKVSLPVVVLLQEVEERSGAEQSQPRLEFLNNANIVLPNQLTHHNQWLQNRSEDRRRS
jgi:hypothetical protein